MDDERKFVINEGHAVGNRIVRRVVTWDEFKRRAMQSKDTGETRAQYLKISVADKARATRIKDVGGFVAGEFSKQIRQMKYLVSRSMITLDLEQQEKKANKRPDVTAIIGRLAGKAYVIYSTHKHVADDPRIRIILPLLYDITAENYSFIAESVARFLGVYDCLDAKASIKTPHQIMFWPSHPSDVKPFLKCSDGELWNPVDYMDESIRSVRRAKKQADPSRKSGAMGIFARAYKDKWSELVKNYDLPYEEIAANRWRYSESSSGAGVIVYSDGLFINSFHATDPACGLHNYYDVVRLHKFADQDKMPPDGDLSRCGEKATLKAIMSDPVYKAQAEKEKQAQADLLSSAYDPVFGPKPGGTNDKKAMTDLLFDMVMAMNPKFYRTSSDYYLDIRRDGKTRTFMIGSEDFENFIRPLFRKKHDKILNTPSVKEAGKQLAAEASTGEKINVYLRVAQLENTIYYDLGNEAHQVVQITAQGWQVLNHSPVKFIRPNAMNSLPIPEHGGSIDELRQFINPATENDFKLYVGGILSSMQNAGGDYFIMAINGPAGSGKTTMTDIAHLLIDPSDASKLSMPDKEEDFGLQIYSNWLPTFDNMRRISERMSDMFCKVVSGGGISKRTLFENTKMTTINYKRPVLINGIPDLGNKPDFISRLIRIHTKPITHKRQSKVYGVSGGIMTRFYEAWPRILGALFDAVACALRYVNQVTLNRSIRSIDAAMFVKAAEPALGWSGHDFEDAVYFNQHESQGDALERDPFVQRLSDYMREKSEFEGTAEQVINTLSTGLSLIEQRYFPKPQTLKGRLQEQGETLCENLGITWASKHTNHGTVYTFKRDKTQLVV